MTAQTALWLSSSFAAALFFMAGFLVRSLRSDRHADEAARIAELERELAERESALGETIRERDDAHGRLRELTAERDDAHGRLRELTAELEERTQRLRDAEERARRAAPAADVEAARQRLVLELEAARGKASEVEALRERNATLQRKAAERDRLASELTALRDELEATRAHAVARRRPKFPPRASSPPADGTGKALERMLAPLASRAGMRAAAFADDLGLPIVGIGEHAQGLAAFAGLADELADRLQTVLPVGCVRRIEIEGDHRVIVTAHPNRSPSARFALVTMSVGALPSSELRSMLERSAPLVAS